MTPIRIAVTGLTGQLVQAMAAQSRQDSGVVIIPVGRPALNLARPQTVGPALADVRPDIVVNTAAYTAVDLAEDDRDNAFQINAAGAEAVAAATARLNIPVIQISTDYVFDGAALPAYDETHAVNPQTVYGASKLAGELAVAAANPNHAILRTAWVYSPFSKNFARTMIALARTRDSISVVADQFGNPTSAFVLADGVIGVARQLVLSPSSRKRGVFHLAGGGEASWADLAEEIMALCRAHDAPSARIQRITSAEYPSRAKRPHNSRLDCAKLRECYGWASPPWQSSLASVVCMILRTA